eukprot:GHVR01137612.1.p1 GENE.GHVR01137612.1~~GHVR01137612.1.p1  ORF type:complete len:127 (-),score=11.90 GHVR01137612.1:328-708(-)
MWKKMYKDKLTPSNKRKRESIVISESLQSGTLSSDQLTVAHLKEKSVVYEKDNSMLSDMFKGKECEGEKMEFPNENGIFMQVIVHQLVRWCLGAWYLSLPNKDLAPVVEVVSNKLYGCQVYVSTND